MNAVSDPLLDMDPIRPPRYSDEVHTIRFIWRLIVFTLGAVLLTGLILQIAAVYDVFLVLLLRIPQVSQNLTLANLAINCSALTIAALISTFIASWVHVLPPHLRLVTLFMGRWPRAKGGVCWVFWPFEVKYRVIDQRMIALDLVGIDTFTVDNIPVAMNAVIHYRIADPITAVFKVQDLGGVVKGIVEPLLREVASNNKYEALRRMLGYATVELTERVRQRGISVGMQPQFLALTDIRVTDDRLVQAMAAQVEAVERAKAFAQITEADIQRIDAIKKAFPKLTESQAMDYFLSTRFSDAIERSGGNPSILVSPPGTST